MSFSITDQQLSSMGEKRILTRVQRLLSECFPDWHWLTSPPAQVELQRAIERAQTYGLSNERQCATFACAWVVAGANFDRQFPAPRETLTSVDLNANEKASWLDAWIKVMLNAVAQRALP